MNGFLSFLSLRCKVFSLSRFIASCEEDKKSTNEVIAVYLTAQSKNILNKTLETRGFSDPQVNFVSINSVAKKDDVYVYEPLFGTRAAFRLKGIVKLDDGRAVGVGRISNMTGEVKDIEIEAALPISSSSKPLSSAEIQTLLDLPTRLSNMKGVMSKVMWKGRVPAGHVRDHHYEPVHAQYVQIPSNKQVVVDGYVCSNLCVNEEGKCEFEPVTAKDSVQTQESQLPLHDESSIAGADKESSDHKIEETDALLEDAEDDVPDVNLAADPTDTCPVCVYLKEGPCKDEFLAWDACIRPLGKEDDFTVCFNVTTNMLRCMRKYEYYDIMVAGQDFNRIDELDKLSTHTTSHEDK
ncbi:hypothetical protein EON65_28835 [archaeon]|nr:MAG: hypothetical protein EON65_28835 [archaeon]